MKNRYLMLKAILPLLFISSTIFAQERQLTVLNDVILSLKGNAGDNNINVYTTIDEACESNFVTCNRSKKIIGLDFQFANLTGYIPEEISELADLEYINLEYNYLKGTIPKGLSKMKKLEEVLFNGNFLEGPVPMDIEPLSRRALVDLSQNSIKGNGVIFRSRRDIPAPPMRSGQFLYNGRVNMADQFNLEGCRSPDSIFIARADEHLDAVRPERNEKDYDFTDAAKSNSKESKNSAHQNIKKEFKNIERMPRFPGCEDNSMSQADIENCAKSKMLNFIYRNLRYPTYARVHGIEGMAVCQFIINESGQITNAKVVRDIGGRCGNASLWIVNRMNFICEDWTPGLQDGNAVNVLYTLPVKFKLE